MVNCCKCKYATPHSAAAGCLCLPAAQADHEKFKQDAAVRFNAANEEVERLRGELTAKEAQVRATA